MGTDGTASRRPRLVDVARRAGVSTATASLVLRGRPGPSAATADAVRAAAGELGYRADRTASLLARHRTHLLGVLLDITSPFHAELVQALDDEAADRGLDLVLSTVTRRRDEARAAETLLDFRCEALLVLGPAMPVTELDALASSVPTVVVGREGTARVPGVRASDDQGLELAVDHLVGLGHGRIAYVDGPRGSIATARRSGYRAAMRRHGLRRGHRRAARRGHRGGRRRGRRAAARAHCPTAARQRWSASTTGVRSGCATAFSAKAAVPEPSASSATTTAHSRGWARWTSPRSARTRWASPAPTVAVSSQRSLGGEGHQRAEDVVIPPRLVVRPRPAGRCPVESREHAAWPP